jgi:P-type Ca2+ transporter type 2C
VRVRVHHHLPGRTRLRIDGRWPDSWKPVRAHLSAQGLELLSADKWARGVLVRHPKSLDQAAVATRLADAIANPAPCEQAGTNEPEIAASAAKSPPPRPRDPRLDEFALSDARAALARCDSPKGGLSANEVAERRRIHGPNATRVATGRARRDMVLEQVTTMPVGMLLGSAVLSLATGGVLDAVVTLGVVAANSAIGFSTENATERLIRRLSKPVEHEAAVYRDGKPLLIPAQDVVPGDILVLAQGMQVAADARLVEVDDLSVDESALTGESLPVEKTADPLKRPPAAVSDRFNIVHAGTVVTGGNGRAVVFATGTSTEMAHTRGLISSARPPRPAIEDKLDRLGQQLAAVCLGVSGLVLGIGLLRGERPVLMVKSAIALAVAAIPEGLPAVATTTMALSARTLEKQGAYVRALPAIESIGTVDTICFDKTGTLTENRMVVVSAIAGDTVLDISQDDVLAGRADLQRDGSNDLFALAQTVSLCNEAREGQGSGTEQALLEFAGKAGVPVNDLRGERPMRDIRSRNLRRRWMASEHFRKGSPRLYLKGAPDELLSFAVEERVDGQTLPLSEERRAEILKANEAMAARGLRVLGVGYADATLDEGPSGRFVWQGLVGLADPLRFEAREAIEQLHGAGIRTVMITGDQPATALAVGQALGLSRSGIFDVADGPSLATLSREEIGRLANHTSIFARVSPADKLRIVEAMQAAGHRVAMIGDGVNDGPALRAASVGIAMGQRGTAVAREVADLVIADDDLRELARAIARGRATEDNIRNAVRYLLSTNLSEIMVMVIEELHGRGEMETPMELFWLNLVTDIMPALGLALAEPGEVMARPPAGAERDLFSRGDAASMLFDGAGIAAAALIGHFISLRREGVGPPTRTVTFLTLAMAQILQGWVLRDRTGRNKRRSERRLEATLLGAGGMLALPFMVPRLRNLLGVGPVHWSEFALSATLAGGYFALAEGRRLISVSKDGTDAPSQLSPPGRER